jgi:membrane associated rhomboid family serine protease
VTPTDTGYGRRFTLSSLSGPFGMPPRDLLIILITLFVTFVLKSFAATRLVPELLRLTPLVWRAGFVWQLITYPFIGYGSGFWFPISMLILYMFGRQVYDGLGRKHFWRLVLITSLAAGGLALLVEALQELSAGLLLPGAFQLVQGQNMLVAIVIAAFATANRRVPILFLFVLPIEARYFLGIEIVFAFFGFLDTHDLGGFFGICAAVGLTYLYVRDGGFGRGLRQTRLRVERWRLQRKLERLKRRRGLQVIKGKAAGNRSDPWLN